MKRLLMIMVGLAFTLGAVCPAFTADDPPKKEEKKKGKKKKKGDKKGETPKGSFAPSARLL